LKRNEIQFECQEIYKSIVGSKEKKTKSHVFFLREFSKDVISLKGALHVVSLGWFVATTI
jgi:hypothetical protein